MENDATGGSGGSIHGESVSPFAVDYNLNYLVQSYMQQGSEKNLQPQIDQTAGTGGSLPIWTEDQGIQAAAQTQPWPHGQPAGTGGVPIWTTNQEIQAAAQTQPWPHGEPQGTEGSPIWRTNQGIPAATQIPIWATNQGIPAASQMPIWTTYQGIQAAAQTQPWPHGQPAGTGGFLPIWTTNQGVQAPAQAQPWSQQQVTDTYGFSPELWTTKQGCQASAATTLLTEPATSGMKTPGCSAGNEEERRARKRENDRRYRRRLKEEREDLENTVPFIIELWSEMEALKAELRRLNEYIFGNQRLQSHRFNEMAQDKISTSRKLEEGPALTNSQTPSSSEPRAQVQEKVLPQALRQSTIRFLEKRKQRGRNAAPYNLGKTKRRPQCNK